MRLCKRTLLAVIFIVTCSGPAFSQCLTSQLNVSTGLDPSTNSPYAAGVQDQYWSITYNSIANQAFAPGAAPYQAYVVSPHPAWATYANTGWLCFRSSYNYVTNYPVPDSTYFNTYTRRFKNCLADSFTFNVQYHADNWLSNLVVDGVSYFYQPAPAVPSAAQFNTTNTIATFKVYLTPGTHTIDAIVFNYPVSGTNPTGLNLGATITGTTTSLIKDTCTSITTALSITPPTATICYGGKVSLTASGSLTYSWTPASNLSATNTDTTTANPLATTKYYVTGTGCAGNVTDSITITVKPPLSVNAGNDTSVCGSKSVQLKATVGNIAGSYTIQWSPAGALNYSTIINPIAQNIQTSTQFVVTVTDANFCTGTDTMQLNVIPAFTVTAGPDLAICEHDNLQLNVTVGSAISIYTVQWSPGIYLSDSGIANPMLQDMLETKHYVVTVIPDGGADCAMKDTLNVEVIPHFTVDISDTTVCDGTIFSMRGTEIPGFSYSWSPTEGLSNPNIFNPVVHTDKSTSYVVTGTNHGCIAKDTVVVTVLPNPPVTLGPDNTLITCAQQSVQLFATGAPHYSWSPDWSVSDTNRADPMISNLIRPTTLSVTGIGANGCKTTASVLVDVKKEPQVFVPNAFTPNNDGKNDKIRPLVHCDFIVHEFQIFNRWGQRVHHSWGETNGWDGTFLHGDAEVGTYYYQLTGYTETGETVMLKGDITLIR